MAIKQSAAAPQSETTAERNQRATESGWVLCSGTVTSSASYPRDGHRLIIVPSFQWDATEGHEEQEHRCFLKLKHSTIGGGE